MSLAEFLKSRHVECDDLFTTLEQLAADGDWAQSSLVCTQYCQAMERHLSEEENVVFPAFEAATGMTQGPTQVMRAEHAQMRELIAQIEDAQQRRDGDAMAGAMQTLLILMQQHNMKEENILYPMFDESLPARQIIAALSAQ